MTGQSIPRRGRPRKADLAGFELLALAAFARPCSQQVLGDRMGADLGATVHQPTVRDWLLRRLPRLARPTVSIKRPDELGLRLAYLMFRREPARAVALARVLAREPLVSRVERWAGEINVVAEVMTRDQEQLDALVERFEPDEVHELVSRVERARVPLRNLGREQARSP
jgi:hypothetical protein